MKNSSGFLKGLTIKLPVGSSAAVSKLAKKAPGAKSGRGGGKSAGVVARRFFDALGDLYPCATCRADLRADVDAHPPRCESREALAKWVCERHNVVNEKLGKAKMSCAIDALDARWRRAKTTE